MSFSLTTISSISVREACEIEKPLTIVYLFAKFCLNKMLVHAFYAPSAQCLDYAKEKNVWNAIILEAVPRNEQFLKLQVKYPESGTMLCFAVMLCYTSQVSCTS